MIRKVATTVLVIMLLTLTATVALAQDEDRPFIGVSFAPDGTSGILVTQVVEDSPAEAAELEASDVIVLFDGQLISADNLAAILDEYAIGDTVTLGVLRDGETLDLELTLGERPPEPEATEEADTDTPRRAQLGISVGDADDDGGVIVLGVGSDSPAADAGIEDMDVITGFDGDPVANSDELITLVGEAAPGDVVEVELMRADESLTVEVTLGEAPPQPGDAVMAPVPDGVTYNSDNNTWAITSDELAEFGIENGDVITAINGETIATPMDGFDLLGEAVLGEEPTLIVERGDETLEVDVPIPVVLALVSAIE